MGYDYRVYYEIKRGDEFEYKNGWMIVDNASSEKSAEIRVKRTLGILKEEGDLFSVTKITMMDDFQNKIYQQDLKKINI